MRSLPHPLDDEVLLQVQYGCYLLQIDLPVILRYTSLDVPLSYDSKSWLPRRFEFGAAETSMGEEIDKMDLSLDNVDHSLTELFHEHIVRRKLVWLWYVGLSRPATIIGVQLIFNGSIDQVEIDHNEVKIDVMSALAYWRKKVPGRIYQATCPWIFEKSLAATDIRKGKYCRYSGAGLSCNQTYKRCTTLGNTANFGGFRFLPWLLNRTFPWGPEKM